MLVYLVLFYLLHLSYISVYSGSCILRPPMHPGKFGRKLKMVWKQGDTYIENIGAVSLMLATKIRVIFLQCMTGLKPQDHCVFYTINIPSFWWALCHTLQFKYTRMSTIWNITEVWHLWCTSAFRHFYHLHQFIYRHKCLIVLAAQWQWYHSEIFCYVVYLVFGLRMCWFALPV